MKNISVLVVILAFVALCLIILGHAIAHVSTSNNFSIYATTATDNTNCALDGIKIESCQHNKTQKEEINYIESFEVFKQ